MNNDEIIKRYFEQLNKDIDEILSQTPYENTKEIYKKIEEMANKRYPEWASLGKIGYMQDMNMEMLLRTIRKAILK